MPVTDHIRNKLSQVPHRPGGEANHGYDWLVVRSDGEAALLEDMLSE